MDIHGAKFPFRVLVRKGWRGGFSCEEPDCAWLAFARPRQDSSTARDAAVDLPNSAACAAVCGGGSCHLGTCVVTCSASACTCRPPGVPCSVIVTAGAAASVDCTSASSCAVDCAAAGSCGAVTCGGASCAVNCAARLCIWPRSARQIWPLRVPVTGAYAGPAVSAAKATRGSASRPGPRRDSPVD